MQSQPSVLLLPLLLLSLLLPPLLLPLLTSLPVQA
jgi:hypothetical protein